MNQPFKVNIENELNGRKYEGCFSSDSERSAWILKHRQKETWGKEEHWVLSSEVPAELASRVVDTETVLIEGESVEKSKIKSDISIILTDLNQDAAFQRLQRSESLKKSVISHKAAVEFGQELIALVGMKNDEKNLSHAQKDALMSDSEIMLIVNMLSVGRIGRAKQLTEAYTVDEITLTSEDKTEIIQHMEDFLAEMY